MFRKLKLTLDPACTGVIIGRKIRNNRMNNKMIIENIPFGVILHNSDGLIIDANKQVEQILMVNLT